jgi:phosphatidylserine decarboxylase
MADAGAPETGSSPPDSASTLRGVRRVLLALLYLLPKNAMSRMVGRFASLSLPAPLQRAEIRLFVALAGVDLAEARDPIDAFSSLQHFFARALRDGARPIEGDELCLVAPCDGAWGESGRIESGTLVQVKGRNYGVAELLGDPVLAHQFDGGCFATFYLSPRDYHRFHTPTAGRITRIDYHPGALWPVNSIGLQGIEGLFARNERICAFLDSTSKAGKDQPADDSEAPSIALVAVGATMVGSVRLTFDELTTNVPGRGRAEREFGSNAPNFARGEEWGHFEFGSTIVMLTRPTGPEIDFRPLGEPLRLGQRIGRLRR